MTRTYYDILQIHPAADLEVIKAAYRALAKKFHPDKTGGDTDALMREINLAYEVLSDAAKRAAYDDQLLNQPYAASAGEASDEHVLAVSNVLAAMLSKDIGKPVDSYDRISRRGSGTGLVFDCGEDSNQELVVWVQDNLGQSVSLAYLANHISQALKTL
ncbi:MAG: J domain-containing protein [Pseudomonas sp.]|uniref:J domain-containing protein n=1 Tax=Ectopseudomonas mendocina TaxID=300 RepID=UPI0023ECF95C|nr:J domain-containing protein [Pseudomonas mendocina]